MRISDWSSDVCSSDLTVAAWFGGRRPEVLRPFLAERVRESCAVSLPVGPALRAAAAVLASPFHGPMRRLMLERSEERRVGKECVIRVDLGGRRIIKKNNKH